MGLRAPKGIKGLEFFIAPGLCYLCLADIGCSFTGNAKQAVTKMPTKITLGALFKIIKYGNLSFTPTFEFSQRTPSLPSLWKSKQHWANARRPSLACYYNTAPGVWWQSPQQSVY